MKSLWSDSDAEAAVARYAREGVNRDLALRVYTSRLLGADRELVLHGGGNTSVKTTASDTLGRIIDVICVKGSGWDLATIEPPGLPAVRLDPLRELASLTALTDEAMVNLQRSNLLDSTAPNPSVETLLHAFLPHRFVDHTHADAVLALTDQPDGAEVCRAVYGDRVAILPYIAPGFELSLAAKAIYEQHPECIGLVLVNHGVFTFADTARESYERMIELVTLAEQHLAARGRADPLGPARSVPGPIATVEQIAPLLRGIVARGAEGPPRRFMLDFRTSDAIRAYVDGADLTRYGQSGVVTPDHVIRIKPRPLIVPTPLPDDLDAFADAARAAVNAYIADYHAYFTQNTSGHTELDPLPRVILVPGVGLFGLGANPRAAAIAADLAETTVRTVTAAESIGRFRSITEAETFAMEYWSLEQAKLARGPAEGPLARRIVAVTGGAGTIGAAIGRAFGDAGATVALLDRDEAPKSCGAVAATIGALAVTCDVTDAAAVRVALGTVCRAYGGLDIVVSNAGAAWQGRIGDVDDATLRASFELNFFAHQHVAQAATAILREQGLGGVLLFNVSKQAVNPGPDFGPYGLPKAATLALLRQYAVDHGSDGIRANGVNADRIPSGILTDDMVRARADARGVTETDYLAGNLLGEAVRAEDVANAFVDLARAEKTTGAVITVDGGNIAAALR